MTHQGSAGALISYVGSMNMLIPPIPYKPDFFNPWSKLCAFALISRSGLVNHQLQTVDRNSVAIGYRRSCILPSHIKVTDITIE